MQVQSICHDTLPWLISISLGIIMHKLISCASLYESKVGFRATAL